MKPSCLESADSNLPSRMRTLRSSSKTNWRSRLAWRWSFKRKLLCHRTGNNVWTLRSEIHLTAFHYPCIVSLPTAPLSVMPFGTNGNVGHVIPHFYSGQIDKLSGFLSMSFFECLPDGAVQLFPLQYTLSFLLCLYLVANITA